MNVSKTALQNALINVRDSWRQARDEYRAAEKAMTKFTWEESTETAAGRKAVKRFNQAEVAFETLDICMDELREAIRDL